MNSPAVSNAVLAAAEKPADILTSVTGPALIPLLDSHTRSVLDGARKIGIDEEMISKALHDFIGAFQALSGLPPAITVFGSARPKEGSAVYDLARETGRELADAGFAVITGGGPGVMEAANRGAKESGGLSVGLSIKLPHEQGSNPFVDIECKFDYFFARKVMLTKYSCGFAVMPGGFGTCDELFELLTLRQTGKMPNAPIVLIGTDFWEPLVQFLAKSSLGSSFIKKSDLESIFVTDSPQIAAAFLKRAAMQEFELTEQRVERSAVPAAYNA